MFSLANLSFSRLLPQVDLWGSLRRRVATHKNGVDPEDMPEHWQKDIGMLDGRDRRGPPKESALRAARMTYSHRYL